MLEIKNVFSSLNKIKEETQEILEKYVPKDWAEQLSNYIDVETFKSIRNKIGEERKTRIIYPESKEIFKAFQMPLNKVKVVIIGQD